MVSFGISIPRRACCAAVRGSRTSNRDMTHCTRPLQSNAFPGDVAPNRYLSPTCDRASLTTESRPLRIVRLNASNGLGELYAAALSCAWVAAAKPKTIPNVGRRVRLQMGDLREEADGSILTLSPHRGLMSILRLSFGRFMVEPIGDGSRRNPKLDFGALTLSLMVLHVFGNS